MRLISTTMQDQLVDGTARILIVEDESSILTALALLLEMEGFEVVEATDGRQGLEQLRAFKPDLVISDYMMPYMDGIEMIRQIRQDPEFKRQPIVLISAALPQAVSPSDLADATLPKPINIDELLKVIWRLLLDAQSAT